MERNPFIYSGEVAGEYFWDRERERQELRRDILDSQKVVIYSKRRVGKTSLVKEVIRNLPKTKFITAYVDLYPTASVEDFVISCASAMSGAVKGPVDKVMMEIRSILRSFTPALTIDDEGKPVLTLDIGRRAKKEALLAETLEAFPAYCHKKGRQGVFVMDEFQQIASYDKDHRLEATLRSHFQTHDKVAYIFLGSKKHLLMDIFSAPSRPFYHSSKLFPLGGIERRIMIECVEERFKKTGRSIGREDTGYLVSQAENHIYYTQRLAHAAWNISLMKRCSIGKMEIDEAFKTIVGENSDYFRSLCELLTPHQLGALKVAAHIEEDERIFSKDSLKKRNWQKDSLKQALDTLVEKDVLSRENGTYKLDDVFFKRWLD